MHYKAKTLLCLATIALSPVTMAEGRWYINPMVGQQNFDSERNLDDETTLILGGEYRYNDNWATELRYLDSSPDVENSGADVDLNQIYLDGLYYLKPVSSQWQPYGVVGIGHAEFERNQFESKETQANVGVGLRYAFNHSWSLRADVRTIYGFDDDTIDTLTSVGLSYAFGGKKSQPVEAMPAPKAAPVVADSDGDGVNDPRDNCPNTPAGAKVDGMGCPLDSDGDGVYDYADLCLNTPSGFKVNADGCMLKRAKEVSFDLSLRFALDSAKVEGFDQDAVTKVVTYLRDHSDATVIIEGHTDSSGNDAYNKNLSERRASAVAKMLTEQYGIAANRLSSAGYGEERPIADNNTAEGRAANRRVVAKVRHKTEEAVAK